jgi:hypothetical protein
MLGRTRFFQASKVVQNQVYLSISAIEHRLDQDRQASIVGLLQKKAHLLEEKLASVVEPI